ncbi:MAG: hypothetical protein R3293_27675 [Candidatus Promineifilaceae bacterium]|nr:hypothetical protein [Candidatus Promineifilaceae bacterium]
MNNLGAIKSRYLEDEISIRLGGLATNLSRIKSFSGQDANQSAVAGLIDESKYFIEWTAAELDILVAEELVLLQVLLARWRYSWEATWADKTKRKNLAEEAGNWSVRVLELSGLVRA